MEHKEMVDRYLAGEKVRAISKSYNISIRKMYNILRDHGVLKKIGEANRKWNYNKLRLQKNTPELAYCMGFLIADGCLNISGKYNRKRLCIYLAEQDKEHLYKFCNFIELPIECISITIKNNTQNIYGLRIDISEQEVYILSKYGIVPRKTYNFVKPDISQDLLPHYLRGWFDGDGYLRNNYPEIFRITGNKKSLEWYANNLKKIGFNRNISFVEWHKDNVWGKIQIGGRINIATLTNLLQVSGNVRLERKWEEPLKWVNLVKQGKIRKRAVL